jgi:hypothetical protein
MQGMHMDAQMIQLIILPLDRSTKNKGCFVRSIGSIKMHEGDRQVTTSNRVDEERGERGCRDALHLQQLSLSGPG